jgi:hypothetical protein
MWPVVKRSFVLGVITLAGASVPAYAGFSDVLDVKVPFPFMVNGEMMPAGSYVIERDADMSGALIIRGEHGTTGVAILNTRPDSAPTGTREQPSLEFKRVEGQYQLSHIRMGGEIDRSVDVH